MAVEAPLALVDKIFFANTKKHLNDLENAIVQQVWQGKKYLVISEEYGCTEGHVKDIASQLWKILSAALNEKVTKTNFRSVIERQIAKETKISSKYLNFIGRNHAIESLNELIEQGNKTIVIRGKGGIGKTTLAREYLQRGSFEITLELLMAKESHNITSVESTIEEWLTKDFHVEPGREFGITLSRLKRELIKRKVGILIDNLEPILDRNGKIISPHRNYLELFRILADRSLNSLTLITSRDRLGEPSLSVEHYHLPGLEFSSWQEYFNLNEISSKLNTIREIHHTYGGNAKAMGIICGTVTEDFNGNLQNYWQENKADPLVEIELKNLVASQFDRLQKLDPKAYKILCRLGGFRYQDIATVSRNEILTLFWNINNQKYSQIIRSLKNRSLIEFAANKYWLHPIIRAEARSRLAEIKELAKVHRHLAEFWTQKIEKIATLSDAIAAWEAFYHYLEIKDFEAASQVLLKSRINQWEQYLPLGSTLYRMGLLQSVLTAITSIIDRIRSDYSRSELNNILGDIYWITGDIPSAIAAQEKTINIATKCLNNLEKKSENQRNLYYLKMLEVDSLLSIGFYKIDLWELAAAAKLFKKVVFLADNTPHYRWAEKANICLALVNSYLNTSTIELKQIDKIYNLIVASDRTEYKGRFAYFIQIIGQTYINLGNKEKARQMCDRAIAFASQSNYTQVKAKTLMTLAEINRQEQKYNKASSYHQESIQTLEQIGAQCDLANAYLQYAITLKKMKKLELSNKYFNGAIELFTKMKAPQQIARVKKIILD